MRFTLPQPVIDTTNPTVREESVNGIPSMIEVSGPGFMLNAGLRATGQWKVCGHIGSEDIREYEYEKPSAEDLIYRVEYEAKQLGYAKDPS